MKFYTTPFVELTEIQKQQMIKRINRKNQISTKIIFLDNSNENINNILDIKKYKLKNHSDET